ncbi:MAG: hypothetical protein ABI693_01695 [Bryobacteraceae bacterium]
MMSWSQYRVLPDGTVVTMVVKPDALLSDLTPETRHTLLGFIREYRDFIMRERSWRRSWSRPERGIDVDLSFLNEDMKAAAAAWTAAGQPYQMAVLLPGYDRDAEQKLLAKMVHSLPVVVPDDRPAVVVIPGEHVPDSVRPVLQTDLLTLPVAFFTLAEEAELLLGGLE